MNFINVEYGFMFVVLKSAILIPIFIFAVIINLLINFFIVFHFSVNLARI